MKLQRGFTLIEVMVVVAILSILAAVLVPRIMDRPEQARQVKARQDILAIESALDLYHLDNGQYPTQQQGLAALVSPPTALPKPSAWRQYLKRLPTDPWGHPYQYKNPGEHDQIDIYSQGPDGHENVIANWQE